MNQKPKLWNKVESSAEDDTLNQQLQIYLYATTQNRDRQTATKCEQPIYYEKVINYFIRAKTNPARCDYFLNL